jgi:hypothetical protein
VGRHGLHKRKRHLEVVPSTNKTPPSWQLLSVALSDSEDELKEPKGQQRSMANALVGGNINSRKTRFLQFVKTETTSPGTSSLLGSVHFTPCLLRCLIHKTAKDTCIGSV